MNAPRTPSLVWPADPASPNAATSLTVDDIVTGGGGAALRAYLVSRFAVVEDEEPGTAKGWTQLAVEHMLERVGDRADMGGVEVSTASLQLVLAYIAWLERPVRLASSGEARP